MMGAMELKGENLDKSTDWMQCRRNGFGFILSYYTLARMTN